MVATPKVYVSRRLALAATLEELHCALVLLGCCTSLERPEIASLPSLWILLARVEPILSGLQLADHVAPLSSIAFGERTAVIDVTEGRLMSEE
jgi:hypothetical protein